MAGSVAVGAFGSPQEADWLVEGRYVVLTAERYRPGSVTHFDFRKMDPPRSGGFFLIRGENDFVALPDHQGCFLEYRGASKTFHNPCHQRTYTLESILEATGRARDLARLPVRRDGGWVEIDVSPLLHP